MRGDDGDAILHNINYAKLSRFFKNIRVKPLIVRIGENSVNVRWHHTQLFFGGKLINFDRKVGGLDHFKIMVDLFGRQRTCAFLDIHRTTLDRILAGKTRLPKAYLIALYWETPWGRSVVDTSNHYAIYLANQRVETLERHIVQLEASIKTLVMEANHMSANSPVFRMR